MVDKKSGTGPESQWKMKALQKAGYGLEMGVYATDVHTDEIVYMNDVMKEAFEDSHPEGKKCYSVFQPGRTSRCENCPVEKLLQSEEQNPYFWWEEYNTSRGRIFENCDSLYRWPDGRIIHLQQSIDVTEGVRQLQEAQYDELTGVYVRRTGKEKAGFALLQARRDSMPLCLCLFDLNGLKRVNDRYGHAEGDQYLLNVLGVVKQNMEEGQFIARLSGDEFLMVLPGMYQAEAEKKMSFLVSCLDKLEKSSDKPYRSSFCYGIEEVLPGDKRELAKLLAAVDEKMYIQKRRYHIRQAERKLAGAENLTASEALENGFYYDKERLYDALVNSTDHYIYVCNMKTGVFRYPRAMVEEFDLPGEVIENAAAVLGAKVHPDDRQAFMESNQEVTDGRSDCHLVEYRARNFKGEWVWLRCRGHVERDERGEAVLFAGMITNLGKKNQFDHMTGLLNRFALEDRVDQLISQNSGQMLGILLLGLDDFKHVNDLYDRSFGDEVIRITAQKIQSMLPSAASLYRFDGDAYAVLFRDTAQQELWLFYKELQEAFGHQQSYEGRKYFSMLSGGGVFYPTDGENYQELMKRAAYSLEYSKEHGKNRLTFYSREIMKHQERNLELTEILRESMEHGFRGFSLHYQPLIRSSTETVCGAEALARFECEKYGSISPAEFIPLLEENGMILPVGRWIFEQASAKEQEWAQKDPDFIMSINISWLQLENPAFLEFLEESVEAQKLDTDHIILELTESYIASNFETVRGSFEKLHAMGFQVAMDDFGTGYSSLGILKMAAVDFVKIDRAFIKDVLVSPFDVTFVEFIVKLCHDMRINVVLEGLETREQLGMIEKKGVDIYQGFYYGCPVPEQLFERYFK